MSGTTNNNLIPILELKEVHSINVCLSESDINCIKETLNKLNIQYIYKALVLCAFMYDCNPNDVLNYEIKNNKENDRQKSNIINARYIWVTLMLNIGDITIKDLSKLLGIHIYKVKYILNKFKEKAVFGTLLLDKYNAAKEILLKIK